MTPFDRDSLQGIKRFDQLVKYLRDELDWPIDGESFDDLTFDYEPEELGIDMKTAAKIQEIKQLRPLISSQPWGIFFVKFEPKRLPVVALRRLLSQLVIKRRASSRKAEQPAWHLHDLLFISNYGEGEQRQITFAHFSQDASKDDLPTLKVLGWDNLDTPLHIDHVAEILTERLTWPDDETDVTRWRESWGSAFTLRHREVINTSKDLAMRLAVLARAIRDRIRTILSIETKNGPITKLLKAFQEALIHDLDADGFADMYAQTIAYGLLSARITNPKANTATGFASQLPVTNPFLKELMETFLHIGGRKRKAGQGPGIDFDELGVSEVVELLDDANMEAVVRDFGDKNPQEDPVIHFYELFLKEYDAKKRMQRGVFYTPRPAVSHIVRSVHELLQSEFGLEDGLASTVTWGEMQQRIPKLKLPLLNPYSPQKNQEELISPTEPFVVILDLATGTGTFLVEAIDVIHRTLVEKWKQEGHGEKKILDLWNDYVPKHLLPRLHGYELLMAPYAIAHLKIGLKLHETGYRFASSERARIYITNALEPPQTQIVAEGILPALAHEAEAVNAVKSQQRFTVVIGNPPYSISSANNGEWITDLLGLYKRAVRHERNIQPLSDDYVKFFRLAHWLVLQSRAGLLGLITNHTFLSGLIHRGMREALLADFDVISVLDLHGSALLGLATSDGGKDENVFDIQQGVSITIARCSKSLSASSSQHLLAFNELWGERASKYSRLLDSVSERRNETLIEPEPPNFFFVPTSVRDADYDSWVSLSDVFQTYATGFVTGKDDVLISFTEQPILRLCEALHDSANSDTEIARRFGLDDTSGWPVRARRAAMKKLPLSKLKRDVRTVMYRPFDQRFTLYCDFLQRARFENMQHMLRPNLGLIASRMVKGEEPAHWYVARMPVEKILLSPKTSNNAVLFPLYQRGREQELLTNEAGEQSNLSQMFIQRLGKALGLEAERHKPLTPEDIFHYAYAVFHSPEYRTRYAEFLKIDFPRLPLTSSLELFRTLAKLGGELVALHLLESPKVKDFITTFTGNGDNSIPKKPTWNNNAVWINSSQRFEGVSEEVWNFHIGGYQVCQKWLKDRKGRTLTADDIAHYQKIVVALAETIRLMGEIDEVIEEHGGWPGAFTADRQESQ